MVSLKQNYPRRQEPMNGFDLNSTFWRKSLVAWRERVRILKEIDGSIGLPWQRSSTQLLTAKPNDNRERFNERYPTGRTATIGWPREFPNVSGPFTVVTGATASGSPATGCEERKYNNSGECFLFAIRARAQPSWFSLFQIIGYHQK